MVFIAKLQHKRLSRKYLLDIPLQVKIGYGLYISHGQCVVINPTVVIGNNVNLSQFTTIGSNNNNSAIIGDYVYIGPSVCIVEKVFIGDHVIIGAGSVITKNCESNSTVVGVPGKLLNNNVFNNCYIQNPWNVMQLNKSGLY
ncbi:serine acetyltransferase [Photobacterium piscicola]|uniref:serine acetyltransferase n=1 Tax=Photobacterium piscicola TaxID=1378299 RepID=UPI002E18F77A|nr:serine acetyltransferase [Photobacterium piscicola]